MAARKRRDWVHTIITSPISVGLLVVVAVFLGMSVVERYSVAQRVQERAEQAALEHEALLERKQALEERVEYLQDERGKEIEIRRHFDVAKENEQVVIILDDEDEVIPVPEAETQVAKPWYQFW